MAYLRSVCQVDVGFVDVGDFVEVGASSLEPVLEAV